MCDIFAGAGGSSTGAEEVAGVQVRLAANHWPLAVAVHQENHQATEHACVDLHMEDPRNFPKTDLLWASPECTRWSIANAKAKELSVEMGGDPSLFDDVPDGLQTSDEDEISRSRLLMFDVLRFIEHHRYRAVIVENVVDIATQPKYTAAWAAWRRGLVKLGYDFRAVSLNSMHAQMLGLPAPQSRDRLYIVAWPHGEKAPDIDRALSPEAWCPRCEQTIRARQAWKPGREVGRYRAQYVYACPTCGTVVEPGWLPAAAAIDWTLPAQRIGDRAKPLSPKTMARIREGLRRYGHEMPLVMRNNSTRAGENPGHMCSPIDETMRTLTASNVHSLVGRGIVLEAAGNTYDMASGSGNNYLRAWPISEPLRTLLGTPSKALLVPVEGRDGKPTDQPMGTLSTVDRYALVTLRNHGEARLVSEAMGTVTASGNHHGLVNLSEDDVMACRFRMLEPHEIAAGMSFPLDYRWQGTKRDRTRLAGNAVTPPAARDLVAVVAASIDPGMEVTA